MSFPEKWCIIKNRQEICDWFNKNVVNNYNMSSRNDEYIHYPRVDGSCIYSVPQPGYTVISFLQFSEEFLGIRQKTIDSLPPKWHVAINPLVQFTIGSYYDRQTEGRDPFYAIDSSPRPFLRSHDSNGNYIIHGNCRCSFYEYNPDSDSVLLSYDDFTRLVLRESTKQSPPEAVVSKTQGSVAPIIIQIPRL